MTKDHSVMPLSGTETDLIYRVLCSTPHIYYSQDGGTYALSAPDAETVRALRYLTSVEASALVLSQDQGGVLRAAVARLCPSEDSLDESDWFYAQEFEQHQNALKALLIRLDEEGFDKRAIYSLRPHH